jgi:XTP/dITP diphosphohydrolase
MKKLFVATKNANKLREIRQILVGKEVDVHGLDDFKSYVEPEENGSTFIENARIKAEAVRTFLNKLSPPLSLDPSPPWGEGVRRTGEGSYILADDSGLECADPFGLPGVKSARFAGEQHSYADNNKKLVQVFQNLENPTYAARFVCAMILLCPDGSKKEVVKTCEGQIVLKPRGTNGFGYDPHFYLPQFGKTMAELTSDEKNQISHRGKALRVVVNIVNQMAMRHDQGDQSHD